MDVEPTAGLEEGEFIDSDSDCVYRPLGRQSKALLAPQAQPTAKASSDDNQDDSSDSSDDDDDDDGGGGAGGGGGGKRRRLKARSKPLRQPRKKYDIWCARAQEDVLAETMVGCDVSRIDRSRAVESYDYPTPRLLLSRHNKRKHAAKDGVRLRLPSDEEDQEKAKGSPRLILDLQATLESTEAEVAEDIANKLSEEKQDIIRSLINIAGKQKAVELFEDVRRIEADGGMMIMNGTRRRTPGGVYFFLVKHDEDLTQEQKTDVFGEQKEAMKRNRKLKEQQKKNNLGKKTQAKAKNEQNLPELLTRGELCMGQSLQTGKQFDEDVKNPPPSPATDCRENSSDGNPDPVEVASSQPPNGNSRGINSYAEDFLDINSGNDMDLF